MMHICFYFPYEENIACYFDFEGSAHKHFYWKK